MDSLSDVEEELLRRRSERWFPSSAILLPESSVTAENEDEEQQRTLALALVARAKADLEDKRRSCEEAIHVRRTSIIEGFRNSALDLLRKG